MAQPVKNSGQVLFSMQDISYLTAPAVCGIVHNVI